MPEIGSEQLPFHESVLMVIRRAQIGELLFLSSLISLTVIPKNHREILGAICRRLDELGMPSGLDEVEIVKRSLLAQERRAEEDMLNGKKAHPQPGLNLVV